MTILPRMHLNYARPIAERGIPIRRVGWSDRWWAFEEGFWFIIQGGTKRLMRWDDQTVDDWLAHDWTTLPVGCEQIDGPVDRAALLRIRPFDGLASGADPLSLRCDLPALDSILPSALPALSLPEISPDTAELVIAAPPDPLLLPPPPAGPAWSPARRRKQFGVDFPIVEPPAAPAVLAISIEHNMLDLIQYGPINGNSDACIRPTISQGQSGVQLWINTATLTLTGGSGQYNVTIGRQSSPGVIGTVYWTGTISAGQSVTFTGPKGMYLTWGQTGTVLAIATQGGASVSASAPVTMLQPCDPLPPSSGQSGNDYPAP